MPLSAKNNHSINILSNMNISKTSWPVFNGVVTRLHYVFGQIGLKLWLSWQPKAHIDL